MKRHDRTAILGISALYHDSAAALVVDGEVVAAPQQERFSPENHDKRFPARAVGSTGRTCRGSRCSGSPGWRFR